MRRRICLYALCMVVVSAAAMPIGLHLAALGDADADDDGLGAAVTATAPDGVHIWTDAGDVAPLTGWSRDPF